MSTSKRAFGLALVPLCVWIASIGVAEALFRQLGAKPSAELGGLYENFGDASYKHRSFVDTDAAWIEGHFSVFTDELGLRCSQTNMQRKLSDDTDILVIGDSQGYGQGLNFEDTVVGELTKRAEVYGLAVRNASVGGHLLDNQFELIRWLYGRGLRPKRLVVMLTPSLVAGAGHKTHAVVDDQGRIWARHPQWYSRVTLWLKTHTVVYVMVRKVFLHALPVSEPPVVGLYSINSEAERQANFLANVAIFQQWAHERGIPVYIVYVPLAIELDFSPVSQAAQASGTKVDPNSPYRIARSVSEALGLPFHDLRPSLVHERANGRQLSLFKDPHYNAATSRICADDIWQFLRATKPELQASMHRLGEEHDGN